MTSAAADPLAVAVAHGKPVRLPESLTLRFASRAHRLHHYLWHQTRNSWARFATKTKAQLTELGWAPPRIHTDEQGEIVLGHGAGEDFLFMHRRMILAANQALAESTGDPYAHVVGWTRLPEPGDALYPVPPVFDHPDGFLKELIVRTKTDEYYEKRLRPWEQLYKSGDFLRSVSLGDLGSRIEATLHDALHVRWAAENPLGHRLDPGPGGTPGEFLGIDKKWDDPRYDFLADEYSSHTHPIFFRIHGWVDDRISDWMIANGVRIGFHTSMVDPDWRGKWEGVKPEEPAPPPVGHGPAANVAAPAHLSHEHAPGHGHGHHHNHGDAAYLERLEKAVSVVLSSGRIHHPYARMQGR
jgi:hypothetical protein